MAKKKLSPTELTTLSSKTPATNSLLGDLRQLIEAAREQTARAVNSTLVVMYWQIGKRIREDVLQNERAEYGREILSTLSKELKADYGNGFSVPNLSRMVRFAEVFPDQRIAQTLSAQLSWSHFVELVPLEDSLKRDFYAEMCRVERWSVRTLRHKIGHLLFERTAVSKKPETLIAKDIATLRDEDLMSPNLSSAILIFSIFLVFHHNTPKKTLKTPSCGNWRPSSLRWGRISPSSLDKSESQSTTRTITSICCSTIVGCGVWSRLI